MKRTLNLLLLLPVVVLVTVASGWLYAQSSQPGSHPPATACASCHIAGDNAAPGNASALVNRQEQLCSRCHPDALQMSHPSGFVPPAGQNIPAEYPLDSKGDVTCSTCHEVHGDVPGKLRGTARGQEMCFACHDQAFFDKMPDNGISLMYQAHLSMDAARDWQGLDQYSVECLECHDERGGQDDGGDPAMIVSAQIAHRGGWNHSLGRIYTKAALYGGYRPVNELSKKITLPNGRVGCVSCHEGYSKNHGKLIKPKAGSALCLECHTF